MKKAKKSCVGKILIVKVVKLEWDGRENNCSKGVIYGIPLTVNMKYEFVESLRMQNRFVKNAVRMTRGIEKVETESVLVESETKDVWIYEIQHVHKPIARNLGTWLIKER